MEGIGHVIAAVLFAFFVLGMVVNWGLSDDRIKSPQRIEPTIELIVKDNQIDTLYVYELK